MSKKNESTIAEESEETLQKKLAEAEEKLRQKRDAERERKWLQTREGKIWAENEKKREEADKKYWAERARICDEKVLQAKRALILDLFIDDELMERYGKEAELLIKNQDVRFQRIMTEQEELRRVRSTLYFQPR